MPASRLLPVSFLLLLALFAVVAPLFAEDDCDGSCGRHCGDCVWCPLAAELHGADESVRMISAAVRVDSDRSSRPAFRRALDHVPIPSSTS